MWDFFWYCLLGWFGNGVLWYFVVSVNVYFDYFEYFYIDCEWCVSWVWVGVGMYDYCSGKNCWVRRYCWRWLLFDYEY